MFFFFDRAVFRFDRCIIRRKYIVVWMLFVVLQRGGIELRWVKQESCIDSFNVLVILIVV